VLKTFTVFFFFYRNDINLVRFPTVIHLFLFIGSGLQ